MTPPTDTDDPYYDETHKTYTVTVNPINPAGTNLDASLDSDVAVQTLTYERTYEVDNVTKEIVADGYGDWQLTDGDTYNTVTAKTFAEYIATPGTITQADIQSDLTTFAGTADDVDGGETIDITYTYSSMDGSLENSSVSFLDKDPNADPNNNVLSPAISKEGNADTLIGYDETAINKTIAAIEAKGYVLDGNTYQTALDLAKAAGDTDIRFDNDVTQNQKYLITFKHGETTPTVPSTTTDPNYAATHKSFTVTVPMKHPSIVFKRLNMNGQSR